MRSITVSPSAIRPAITRHADARAEERDVAARSGRSGEKRPGLDAVGHDRMMRAVQGLDPFDDDAVTAGARDPGAHRLQTFGEIDDFRLACRVAEGRRARGE